MARTVITRPAAAEYPPYFETYIGKVPAGDVIGLLRKQIGATLRTLSKVTEPGSRHRYAPGKWSIKEVVGHMADTERIFVYRALCFARGEAQGLPGFDENAFVANASFDARPFKDHVAELEAVRASSLAFFRGLNAEELGRTGTANQKQFTVRSVPYIVAGHEIHHLGVMKERYLGGDLRKRVQR